MGIIIYFLQVSTSQCENPFGFFFFLKRTNQYEANF